MTEQDTSDETTWTEQRERANIQGTKQPIPEGTLNEAKNRREGL